VKLISKILDPLTTFLSLCAGRQQIEDKLVRFTARTLDEKNLRFNKDTNVRVAKLGRCANSISMELCSFLANTSTDAKTQYSLISEAEWLFNESIKLLSNLCFKTAQQNIAIIKAESLRKLSFKDNGN
jgi:hypothetical protein